MLVKMLDLVFLVIFVVELLFFMNWKLHEGRIFVWVGRYEIRRSDLLILHFSGAFLLYLALLTYWDSAHPVAVIAVAVVSGFAWLATAVYSFYAGRRIRKHMRALTERRAP